MQPECCIGKLWGVNKFDCDKTQPATSWLQPAWLQEAGSLDVLFAASQWVCIWPKC